MTQIERSAQLATKGSTLDVLRAAACALMPARHCNGDVAYVEITETLRYHGPTSAAQLRAMTPAKLAKIATASLDAAAAEAAQG